MPARSANREPRPSPGADVLVAALLVVATLGAVGFGVVYVAGDQPQLEGLFLGIATMALAVALGLWARHFLPQGPVEEDRPVLRSSTEDRAAVAAELDRGERSITRRKVLAGLAVTAFGSLGAALLLPFRSLGPFPLPGLDVTAWRDGVRLVDDRGDPIQAGSLPVDGMTTAFPEGASSPADLESSQVVLIRLGPGVQLTGSADADAAPDGHIAFSKVCTHAGCPVGLYQAETHQLVCPCHQSLFDVASGARPVFGPATRALPQLPLRVEAGYLVASSDFTAPPGPGYWEMRQP